jgi:hypothetical protein
MIRRFAKALDSVNLFLPGLLFSPYYDRLDKRPNFFTLILARLSARLFNSCASTKLEREHRWRATRYSSRGGSDLEKLRPPTIELLIVAAEKDFHFLRESARSAIRHSLNPISKLTVVAPSISRSAIPNLEGLGVVVDLIDEENLISKNLLQRLREVFGKRSGWILQQFLTLKFVEQSTAKGVLTLDADTLLLESTLWLDSNGHQVIHVSSEIVSEYYSFLSGLGVSALLPKETHVTHHMLMQPTLLQSIYKAHNLNSETVLQEAIQVCELTGQTQFSLEFELYAQGAKQLEPQRLHLQKFANRTVRVDVAQSMKELVNLGEKAQNVYRSISAHSYTQ